jgi:hypothetical protein
MVLTAKQDLYQKLSKFKPTLFNRKENLKDDRNRLPMADCYSNNTENVACNVMEGGSISKTVKVQIHVI